MEKGIGHYRRKRQRNKFLGVCILLYSTVQYTTATVCPVFFFRLFQGLDAAAMVATHTHTHTQSRWMLHRLFFSPSSIISPAVSFAAAADLCVLCPCCRLEILFQKRHRQTDRQRQAAHTHLVLCWCCYSLPPFILFFYAIF